LNTARKHLPAIRTGDTCEAQHRPIRSLVWQVFGGFVAVVLTLTLAGAAQLAHKADIDDLNRLGVRTRDMERALGDIRSGLTGLRTGQKHMRDDLVYIRTRLDKEQK
jgi:hypothetical protein